MIRRRCLPDEKAHANALVSFGIRLFIIRAFDGGDFNNIYELFSNYSRSVMKRKTRLSIDLVFCLDIR